MYWLKQRIHPTWILTTICFGFVVGVTLAYIWRVDVALCVLVGCIGCGLASWLKRRYWLVVAAIAGIMFGLARGSVLSNELSLYTPLFHKHVIVSGVVADDIDEAKRGSAHVRLRDIQVDGHQLQGRVFATVTDIGSARRSDILELDGSFDAGFGAYAASFTGTVKRVQRPAPGDVALEVRDSFATDVRRGVKEPEASLGIGYLLGQKAALPATLTDALKIVGLTHIVVASGYNLTILVRIGRRIFERLSRFMAVFSSTTLIVAFIAMTGLSPSMTRAGLVTALSLWAWYYGRKFHPVTLLGLVAAITVLVNPTYAWGDLGWLLSFAAFAGVMIIAPVVSAYFFGTQRVPLVGQILIETISAQIATLPIMIMAFQQFSAIAPLANLLVLPFVPLAMLLVAVAGIGGWAAPAIAQFIAWPAQTLLSLQAAVITWCADIPWAASKPHWQLRHLAIYIVGVVVVVGYMKHRAKATLYTTSIVE